MGPKGETSFSQFLQVSQVEAVQIDHNTTCNLKCPQCARVMHGEINPDLKMTELSLDFYRSIFTAEFSRQLKFVLFCGNYGDAVASSNLLEVVEHLKTSGVRAITIFTNGSLRSTSWWESLAKVLNRPGDKVCFSIDGLADTNTIYRRGSHFEKIMENAAAFIQAGGRARWDYLVFKHNEHQVEEAKSLAHQMGFVQFKIKKTNRFIQEKNYQSGKVSVDDVVYQKQRGEKIFGKIELPSNMHYKTKDHSQFEKIIEKYDSWFDYIDATPIRCKALKDRSVFVDFEGKLWPCTWLAAPPHFYKKEQNTQKEQLEEIISKHGENFNNLHFFSLNEVLRHPWFAKELRESWGSTMKGESPKLMTCGRTCGLEYEFSSNSKQNREITEFVS